MKRLVSILLAVMMLLSATALANINYEGDPRIVPEGEDVTLTIFAGLVANTVESFDRSVNQTTQIVENDTGLKLEFVEAPADGVDEKLNLLLNSGDYPNVIMYKGIKKTAMNMYAQEEIFIPLDEYISEETTPNTLELFDYSPAAKAYVTGSDGLIYSLPDYNEAYHCMFGEARVWYSMPFMAQYEAGVPQTTAELKTFMQWIKENDVNGNGDPNDEIPLAFRKENADRFIRWASNFYQIHPYENYRVDVDNGGDIVACFTTPEYKMALEFLNDLYTSGLILEDSFSISVDDLRAIGEAPEGETLAMIIGWGPEDGVVKAGATNRWFDYFIMPPVEGENGQRNALYNANYPCQGGWFVTDSCPEEYRLYAVELGDLFLDEYYGYTAYIGPKGVSWDDPTSPEALGINGKPAWFRELVNYGTQEVNCSWDQRMLSNRYAEFRLSQEAEGSDTIIEYLEGNLDLKDQVVPLSSYNEVMKYYASNKSLEPYAFGAEWCVPALLYADEIADEANDAETAINTYRQEMAAAFVTGTRSLDEFDDYVQELNNMGLETVLQAKNDAYSVLK